MIFQRVGLSLGMLAVVVLGGACGPSGTRQKGGGASRSIIVSPLSVQVSDPKMLLLVNSISIQKPEFQGVTHSSVSEEGLYSVLREVAHETLSMKVVESTKSGKSASADSILRTEIVTMEDLKGSSVGGTPARVAFRMGVYSAKDKRAVWQANYVFQQEAMADNWLKLGDRLGREGSGAGWITAQEIFRRGVTLSLQDFNSRRDSQFQAGQATR